MRDQPSISLETLETCLFTQYGVKAISFEYLALGRDLNAAAYRAVSDVGDDYFVKLRKGAFNPVTLAIPRALQDGGVQNVVAPLRTTDGALWCNVGKYRLTLYPFIQGGNAKVVGLTDPQWVEMGEAMQAIHSSGIARDFRESIRVETFLFPAGQLARHICDIVAAKTFSKSSQKEFAAFWLDRQSQILSMIRRAETLGRQLQHQAFEFTLCHGDIHAANTLVGTDGSVWIVDWDDPVIAPRERDLLFFVGSKIARATTPHEEVLFFRGYGSTIINKMALAYYRYERIIEDLGADGQAVLLDAELSDAARAEEARLAMTIFEPGNIIEATLIDDPNFKHEF